jgi:hypothetical protein
MPRLQLLEVGFQVFTSAGTEPIGTIQAVEPEGRPQITVKVENKGNFDVPYTAITTVKEQKVFLDVALLPQALTDAFVDLLVARLQREDDAAQPDEG